MKKFVFFLVVALMMSLYGNYALLNREAPTKVVVVEKVLKGIPISAPADLVPPCFTPGQSCDERIVDAIDSAQKQILIQAYNYTAKSILEAVIRAKERGVDVRTILDKENEIERYKGGTCMEDHRIPTLTDYKVRIAHNKLIIIDGLHVIGGSYNYTEAAQKSNAENVTIVRNNPDYAQYFIKNWENRAALSRPF